MLTLLLGVLHLCCVFVASIGIAAGWRFINALNDYGIVFYDEPIVVIICLLSLAMVSKIHCIVR